MSSFAGAAPTTASATRVSVTAVGRLRPLAGSPAAIRSPAAIKVLHRRVPAHLDLQTAMTAQLAHPTRVGESRPMAAPQRLPDAWRPAIRRRIVPPPIAADPAIFGTVAQNRPGSRCQPL